MEGKRVIMMDTGSAPTDEIVSRYGVRVMGMRLFLDGETYIDGQEIDRDTYYARIEKIRDFNTNPPLVWDIRKIYEGLKREGFREVIGIHVSSAMSRLIETCRNGRNMVNGLDVRIIDTRNLSAGAYLVAEKIVELLHYGRRLEQVEPLIPRIRSSVHFQISLSTLDYLVKNKRIGRAQGLLGNLFRLRPILGIDGEGYLLPLTKERGKERVVARIADNAVRFLQDRPHNRKLYMVSGLDKNRRQVEAVYDAFRERGRAAGIDPDAIRVTRNRIWPTVANLSGPETYGFAVYGEERPIE